MNKDKQCNNTSGVKGVYFNKQLNKWEAEIGLYNQKIHLGLSDNFEDIVKIRKEAEEKYFGEYNYNEEGVMMNL